VLFVELAALPSPPGEERAVADRVLDYLSTLGLEADEDDAGTKVGSTIGNIYCRLEATGGTGEPVFFKDKPIFFPDQPERGVTYWNWSLVPVKDGSGSAIGIGSALLSTRWWRRAR